ncbi:MAG: PRC-barrel domain-containing protein [Acetobacteraceae bacterium]|nr:PRC-barrel domain-containing protein [Acetobacteraceae bacterium]
MKVSIGAGCVLGALAASTLGASAALAESARGDPAPISSDRVIGSPVYNDENQRIGTLEDVLVRPSMGEPRLVLSVGDFVGHDKRVAVPVSRVALQDGRLVMAGGTREALEKLPGFSYRAGSR